MIWLKNIFKCIIVVIVAIILELTVGDLFVRVFGISAKLRSIWGQMGGMISTGIVLFVNPVVIAILIIGLVGGLWINKKTKIGFILAFLFAAPRLFGCAGYAEEFHFHWDLLCIGLIECLFIITAGGGMYFYISKRKLRITHR